MVDESGIKVQLKLFEAIQRCIPGSISLVDEVSDLLEISTDSMYRRLRGETSLTVSEIVKLCNHYKISFDSLNNTSSDAVTLNFHRINDEESYIAYLRSIYEDVVKINKHKNKETIYAAKDIPLFHDFSFPLIASFKVFYWMRSILNLEPYQGMKFDSECINDEIRELGKEIYDEYSQMPTSEVWTEITPVGLLRQIEFFWDSGIFKSKKDALAICDEVVEEFSIIEKQAETGRKLDSKRNIISDDNSFKLYWSEIEFGNNCILIDIEGDKTVNMVFNTFNRLSTNNKLLCDEIEKWLRNLIKKSTLISDVSEKQRYQFFRRVYDKIDNLRDKISND